MAKGPRRLKRYKRPGYRWTLHPTKGWRCVRVAERAEPRLRLPRRERPGLIDAATAIALGTFAIGRRGR